MFSYNLVLIDLDYSLVSLIQITLLCPDAFNGTLLSDESLESLKVSITLPYSSPLAERTAILLLPILMVGSVEEEASTPAGFIRVLEILHEAHFSFCGMKMVTLSDDSARKLGDMLALDIEVRYPIHGRGDGISRTSCHVDIVQLVCMYS